MTPKKALVHFGIRAPRQISPISVGLIHASFKVEARDGSLFVLQKLHPMLAHPSLTEDYASVTAHLAARGVRAQSVVPATHGVLSIPDDADPKRRWRLLTFVPGQVFESINTAARARACGAATAEFQQALVDLRYRFKSRLALHPYDTLKFYRAFAATAKKFARHPLMAAVRPDVDFLLRELPKLQLPKNLPAAVVHGDLKISNFVFDRRGAHVSAIIDLDTCARFPVLFELGDALRSWCGGREDDPKNRFNLALYRAAVAGYVDAAPRFLRARERALLPRAVKLIVLNLASRFLRDYFEDNYFGWNHSKYETRRAANLARARGQIALYRDLAKKLK